MIRYNATSLSMGITGWEDSELPKVTEQEGIIKIYVNGGEIYVKTQYI